MRAVSIIGARPQFIKEAIVGAELRKAGIDEVLVNTGQHYDANMSDVFIEGLNIKTPDYNLGVGSGSHAYQTATTILRLEEVVLKEEPDVIIVYGDTNATVAGALVGTKLKIPVAHVEAGLRHRPKSQPEEINRRATDAISDLLFCPTINALENLSRENLSNRAHFVGDVMYDLFLKTSRSLALEFFHTNPSIGKEEFILVTIHRDFNTDDAYRLEEILKALTILSRSYRIIFPIHPRTKRAIERLDLQRHLHNIVILEPQSYGKMMHLLLNCKSVISDSGGLQREAYFARKGCVIPMPENSWPEIITAGYGVLVDANAREIVDAVLNKQKVSLHAEELFGDGNAAEKICRILLDSLHKG